MRQVVTIISLVFLVQIGFAQSNKWAVKAGYNYTSGKAVYDGVKQTVNSKSGFGVGVMAKIPFENQLIFTPSVGYSMKGFIVNPKSGVPLKHDFTLHYFTITPALSYEHTVNDNSFFFTAGPYLGITKFGRIKTTTASGTTNEKMEFGYGAYGMFDLGFTGGISYHFNNMFVEAQYSPGLTSINNNEELDKRNLKNTVLSLNIGYYFR
ncbi:MAG: PorT family protein [Ferruginibacter sp.]|nr:PorT family protein [Ferruginibacter sp.]